MKPSTRPILVWGVVGFAAFGFVLWAWAATLSEPYTTAGNYTYDANLVEFTGTTARLKNGLTFAHDTQAEFNGAVSNVTVQASSPWVKQNATTAQGTYTSPTSGAGLVDGGSAAPTWSTFTATKSFAWGEEIPTGGNLISVWHLNSSVADAVGANNGTIAGAPAYAAGRLGSAGLQFINNSADYVDLGTSLGSTYFGSGASVTFSAWVFPTALNAATGTIFGTSGGGAGQFMIRDSWQGLNVNFLSGSQVVQCVAGGMPDDAWHHIAVVWNIGTTGVTAYTNGLECGVNSTTGVPSAMGSFYLGKWGASGHPMNGIIDEAAFYNTALSAPQITDLYKRGVATVTYQMRTADNAAMTTNVSSYFSSIASVPARRYLQYKVTFNTLSTTYRPDVSSVTVTTTGYPTSNPPVTLTGAGTGFTWLTSFAQNGAGTSEPVNTALKYALSPDTGTTWYYHNGTSWAASDGTASQASTAATLNTNIAGFDEAAAAQLPTNAAGSVKVRAFLTTTSSAATPVLDNVDIGYENSTLSLTSPTTWSVLRANTITSSSTGTAVPDQVVEYSALGDFTDTVTTTTTSSHTPAALTSGATAKIRVRSTSVPKLTITSAAFTVAPGALTSTNVQPASLNTGAVGKAKVSFTTGIAIPANGTVLVDFPDTFAVSSGSPTVISGTPANITGLSVTAVNATTRVVTLTTTGGAAAGAAVSFDLTNIKNPPAGGSTGNYSIKTTQADGTSGLDQDLAVAADTIVTTNTVTEAYDASGSYAVSNSALVTFTGTAATLTQNPTISTANSSATFPGTCTSCAWQTTLVGGTGAGLQLNAVTSGNYLSPASGTGSVDGGIAAPTWGTFTATKSVPWGDALVGNETNLVGLWHLDNAGTDSTSNANNGTLNGGVTFAAGRFGLAGSFDGTDDYVNVPDNATLDIGTGSFSIAAWVYPTTSGASSPYVIVSKTNIDGGSVQNGYYLSYDKNIRNVSFTGIVSTANGGEIRRITSLTLLSANAWNHVVAVKNVSSQTMQLYINGVLDSASVTGTASWATDVSNTYPLRLGASCGDTGCTNVGYYFSGRIDEVAIYNTALSTAQATDLYKRGVATVKYQAQTSATTSFSAFTATGGFGGGTPTGTTGLGNGLQALWRFDETSGASAADSKSTNTGTLTNGPTWTTSGRVGGGLNFDGTNDYVAVGTVSTFTFLQNTGVFTIALWAKLDVPAANDAFTYISTGGASANKGFSFLFENRSGTGIEELRLRLARGGAYLIDSRSPDNVITDTNWHHVVAVGNGSTVTFYVDGVADAGTGTMGTLSTGDATFAPRIGDEPTAAGTSYDGMLDDVGLWNRALTGTEVWDLYQRADYVPSGTDLSVTALPKLRYLQYKVLFDTLNTTYRPDVQSVTVGLSGYAGSATVTPVTGKAFTWLTSVTETATVPANTAVKYALSPNDGSNYYWYTAGAWAAADGTSATANTAAELIATSNAALVAFDDGVPTGSTGLTANTAGTLKVKAFLVSTTGSATPTLSNLDVGYEASTLDLWGPAAGSSWTVGQSIPVTWSETGATVPNITVEYAPDGTTFGSATANATSPLSFTPSGASSGAVAKMRIRSTAAPKLTVTSGAFTVNPGVLSSTSVTLASTAAYATTKATVALTTATSLPLDGKIVVTLPAGFDVSGAAVGTGLDAPTGLDGSFTIGVSGQVVTVTRSAGTASAAGAKTVVITGIKNPVASGATGTYALKTTTSGNADIDTGSAAASTITVGTLTSTSVTPASLVAGATGNVTVGFTMPGGIPSGGKIPVTFPAGFGATGAGFSSQTGLSGTGSVTVSGQVVTVGGLSGDAGPINVTLSGIKNPVVSGATGAYALKTTDGGVNDLATGTAAASTITVGALTGTGGTGSPTAVLANTVAGGTGNVVVSFRAPSAIPTTTGKIVVTFPTMLTSFDFSFSGLGATPTATGLTGTLAASATGTAVTITGGSCADGADVALTLTGIKNPGVSGSTGTVTVTTRDGANDLATGTAAATTLTAGALTTTNVEPASLATGYVGNATVGLTTANPIPVDGRIVVTFPAGFALSSGAATAVTGTPSGIDGTLTAAIVGQTVTITRSLGTASAVGAKSLVLTNIKTPTTAGAAAAYALKTTSSGDVDIDQAAAVAADTFIANTLTSTNVQPASLVAGAVGNVTVGLTTANILPADGKILVTFPAGFALSSGSATAATSADIDGTLTAAVSGQTVTVTRAAGTAVAAATAKSLTLSNIKNPTVTGSTGTYVIKTADSAASTIDQDLAVAADTITAGALTLTNVEPASLDTGAVGNVVVSFTPANPIPVDGKLVVTFPTGFVLSSGVATAATSATIDGTLTVGIVGQVVTVTRATGTAIAAGAAKSLTLSNIKNQTTIGSTGTYALKTTTGADVLIDQDLAVTADTIAAASMLGTNVEPALLPVGYVGNVTVSFTTINPIPSGGKIVITMPSGYALSSGAVTAISGTPTGVTGTGVVGIVGPVVTITGFSQTTAGAVSLILTNIKNPTVTGSTGNYQIKTTTSADATIDEKINVAADTITGPILNVLAPIATDSWPVTTTHLLTWRVDGTIPTGGTVKLSYLKTDTTWGIVIPLAGGNAGNEVPVTYHSPNDPTPGASTGSIEWVLPTDAANATAQIKVEGIPAWSPAAIVGTSVQYKITPFLGLTHPTGGQKWAVGSPHKITWQTQGTIARVKVEYSVNGGTWTAIAETYETANDGIVQNTSAGATWTPPVGAAHASVRIRIADSTDAVNNVVSSPLKVTTLAVTAPNTTGLRYLAGSTQTTLITWSSTAVDNVKLWYSTAGSGGPWTQIGTTTADSAKTAGVSFPVPAKSTTTAFIRITDADATPANNAPAGDTDTVLIEDSSDNAFAIYGTLDVTAPDTASLQWASGQQQTITWTVSPANANVVPLVKITVTDLVDALNNATIVASTNAHNVAAGSGSYSWSPTFTTTNAKITVEDAADALSTNQATNAVKFVGVTPQLPAGGESWLIGTQQVIKFSFTSGTLTQAKVEYTTNNGTNYQVMAAGSMQGSSDDLNYTAITGDGNAVAVGANPYYLKWTVPDAISKTSEAKVRITNLNGGAYGFSGAFTITGALAMTTPSGTLVVGDPLTLNWTKTGTVSSVKVEFSPAGTFADTLVSVGTALTGASTSWTVGDYIGTTGKFRVTATLGAGYPTFSATSNAVTIKGKLAFTAPAATSAWAVASSPVVTWTTNGTISTVKLQYATAADSYGTWTDITGATALANSGTFTWTNLPDLVGGALVQPSATNTSGAGTRAAKIRITDVTTGHTGTLQEVVDSPAFTAKWYLVTYNVVNIDNNPLAGLSGEDSLSWSITNATTNTWSTKRYYKQGPMTATWSAGANFNPQTESFTVDGDKTITAILTSTNPDVFDVKYESFYDAGADTVKAKAFLMRRGLLVTTSLGTASLTILKGTTVKAAVTDTAADANGLFEFSFKAADYSLLASDSYFVKIAITYNDQVKNGAGTLNITLPSETKSIINLTGTAADAAAASTLFGKLAGVKTDILAQMGSINDAAAANSLFGKLKNLDKLLGATSDTGSAESVFGRLAKSQTELAEKVKTEAGKGPQTGILNRDPFVKSGNTTTIRYRTATGLSPKLDLYDASNTKRVSSAAMTEIATTGIYEYAAAFDKGWGTGDFSVVVNESTKSSVDSMIMTVSTTDLEAVAALAKKAGGSSSGSGSAATDLSPILNELAALRGMVTMSAGTGGLVSQVAALQQQLSSMQAQLGLVAVDEEAETTEVVEASTKATMSVRDQLKEIAKTMKEMSGPSGLSLHQLFDMQEAQITTAKELQNKIEQIKQATEVTKRIAEEGRQKVQVQTWFESGSVILKILAVNPTDEEQTVPVKAYLPKEVKAEHVMDLGELKLDYDADRQMHFVTATVTLQPNESAVFAIEVEDIWQIPQEQLTRLSDDAKTAVKQLAGTEYEERATLLASQIDLKLASVWERQSDPTLTPEQHIQTHRQNVETLKRLEDDLALLKRMAVTVMNPDAPKTAESAFLNQTFSGVSSNWDESGAASPIAVSLKSRLTTDNTWRLIFGMLVFVGLMSLAAFLLWQRQAHVAMTAEQQLLQQASASPEGEKGGTGPPGP